jgi:hypothetical protein
VEAAGCDRRLFTIARGSLPRAIFGRGFHQARPGLISMAAVCCSAVFCHRALALAALMA